MRVVFKPEMRGKRAVLKTNYIQSGNVYGYSHVDWFAPFVSMLDARGSLNLFGNHGIDGDLTPERYTYTQSHDMTPGVRLYEP